MKGLLRRFLFYTISLFITSQILSGVHLFGGLWSYIVVGIILSLMMLFLKPIIHFISLPLNFITFGLFSYLVNTIILFLLTIFVPQISISAFTFPHLSFFGFATPPVALNKWFAILVASFVISGVYSFLTWLTAE